MMVCIGWVDEDFSVHENPVELIHVPKTDSIMLTCTLKNSLIRLCLPISQCHGQAYDEASNMSGHLSCVATQKSKEFPSALYVHCLANCIKLCSKSVGCQCIPVWNALDFVMDLSQLIQYSPKWSTYFETLQGQLSQQSEPQATMSYTVDLPYCSH